MTAHPLPRVRAAAPGRVNLIGEHLDYNGGRCVPIALDRRTTATVGASPNGHHQLRSGDLLWTGAVGERAEGWAAYVVGVLEELGVRTPLRIDLHSNVPIGSGLSSSAALECAVAVAVNACLVLGLSDEEIVTACIRAETSYVGAPTGGLDQTTAMFANPGQALVLDFADGSRAGTPWRPEAAGLSLLVLDTRVAHQLAAGDGGFASRRADCEAAAAVLGLPVLAAAAESDLDRLEGNQLKRARHVVTEQARVSAFLAAVANEEWAEVGALLTASHASLRDDFEVSCEELDRVVEAALDAGAAGARMTGGGFGGCAIALVPTGRVAAVTEAVIAALDDREAPTVFSVGASRAAELISVT